jgi:hypothetical protein
MGGVDNCQYAKVTDIMSASNLQPADPRERALAKTCDEREFPATNDGTRALNGRSEQPGADSAAERRHEP